MCGIHCSIYKQDRLEEDFTLIKRRGPDHFQQLKLQCNGYTVFFASSVLHMTGEVICSQPVVSERFIFLWNGEMYAGFERSAEESDTMAIFKALSSSNATVESVFDQIQGEYSFVLFDIQKSILYFGRDFFGRRSLLLKQSEDSVEIASIATVNDSFSEVNCLKGIHQITFSPLHITCPFEERKKIRISPQLDPIPSSEQELQIAKKSFSFLLKAVKRRVQIREKSIAILFSGGLDCSILAKACDLILPVEIEIDLLNVAFEHSSSKQIYNVPDRMTGIESFEELSASNPNRKWNFVQINVSTSEKEANKQHILRLMHPTSTIMDYSIATAIWHASTGQGILPSGEQFTSTARTILAGMGADEQFAGYSRHKVKFEREGIEGLLREVQLDIDRISTRNLGRDDRCISDHGKEARFPFLDEEFVEFCSSLPIWHKCNMLMDKGVGEKRLLRVVAEHCLGLKRSCRFPKRAIQFGARTAHSKDSGVDLVSV